MRDQPRITATKMAEYMDASFARKRAILQEQKYPQAFNLARWGQAERPIAKFIGESQTDLSTIDQEISKLISIQLDTDFKAQNRDLCVEALKSFKLLSNQLSFPNIDKILGPLGTKMTIIINGVEISVLPQIILSGKTTKGTKVVGGIKFRFPKSFPLNEKSAGYLASLVHWHCEYHLQHLGKPEVRICYAVDIPKSTIFDPPESYKRRRQQLQEACHEITQRWPNIPPPPNYQEP
ncbi:MAG: hypothetical protein IH626_20025 [Rhodospirillales bacterium]|nr:hypothetical protein [Rhodospirillales bacterium]